MVRGPDPMTHEERLRMMALLSLVNGRLEGQADVKGNHKDKEAKFSAVADSQARGNSHKLTFESFRLNTGEPAFP